MLITANISIDYHYRLMIKTIMLGYQYDSSNMAIKKTWWSAD